MVRHGEVYNPEKILYGRAPGFRLSDRGTRMAEAAGEYLSKLSAERPITHMVSSPLERAAQTAAAISQRLDLQFTTDERLLESQNIFAGRKLRRRDLFANAHRLYNPFRPSWDEAYASVAARMAEAVRSARQAAAGAAAVLVSHQLPIWIVRRHLSGLRLWHSPSRRQCALGSVTSFTFGSDEDSDGILTAIDYHVPAPDLVAAALVEDRAAGVMSARAKPVAR
ncbi:MAG: hypothetical protein DLM55_00870 [Acidimicrobiales bacterium]|nr:MAG: hypothetical protein DLM55_00870 [Acidimicrobiales bacterium]